MTHETMSVSRTEPGRRRVRRPVRMAAVGAAAALALSGCDFSIYDLPLPGGAETGEGAYNVVVEFRDVLDLVPQSQVKVDDVTVGMVDEIELRGYNARVTLVLQKDVELPANSEAEIRQTSLLGEKFVSLAPPNSSPSSRMLEQGDVIPLKRSGRNIEVEEVLGALSLLLNGGGVGQLKTITQELNKAFKGSGGAAKSVLRQLRVFMAQLDDSRFEILRAMENLNKLSVSINKNTDTLDLALEELPSAIKSIDSQRDDLVKMLRALAKLSSVGTRVIKASKQGTIRSLNSLAPILRNLNKAGDAFPRSLQVALTFPFVDGVVGKSPAAARDLQMGDYTNLSINMEVNPEDFILAVGDPSGTGGTGSICLEGLCVDPTDPTKTIRDIEGVVGGVIGGGGGGGNGGGGNGGGGNGGGLPLPGGGGGGNGGGNGGGVLGNVPGVGRAAPGDWTEWRERVRASTGVHPDLTDLLAGGVMPR